MYIGKRIASVIVVLITALGASSIGFAAPAPTLGYTGVLVGDAQSEWWQQSLADQAFTFRLCDTETAACTAPCADPATTGCVWQQEFTEVGIEGGHFSVELGGAVAPFPATVFGGDAGLWLEVEHAGTVMGPRTKLARVPMAVYADQARTCDQAKGLEATAAAAFAPTAHEHVIADVTGLQAALDGKSDNGHKHAWSDLTAVPSDLADGDNDTTYSGADFALSMQSCEAGMAAVAIDATGHLECEAAGQSLPPDGLAAISNGALTNVFDRTYPSTDIPLAIPDGFVAGVVSKVMVPVTGVIRSASVSADVSHPDVGELKLLLIAPDGTTITLLDHQGSGTADVHSTWPEPIAPAQGDFAMLVGKSPVGQWKLQAIDITTGNEGSIDGWTLNLKYTADEELAASGSLTVAKNLIIGGTTNVAYGLAPIGSVTAWLKDLPGVAGLSDGWVVCDGQIIDDPESVLYGQAVPNLNGANGDIRRFLRGGQVSGSTGGTESHTHDVTSDDPEQFGNGGSRFLPAKHLPPYYDVVWIVRIK